MWRIKWRGSEVFFVDGDAAVKAVSLAQLPAVPVPLFAFKRAHVENTNFMYDAARDGQRFIVKMPVEETVRNPVHVVLNWNLPNRP